MGGCTEENPSEIMMEALDMAADSHPAETKPAHSETANSHCIPDGPDPAAEAAVSQAESPFRLPADRAAKAHPALTASDELHFAAMSESLAQARRRLSDRLEAVRKEPVRMGQEAVERDVEVRRLSSRLRALERFGLDACLGRIDPADGAAPLYIGRFGLTGAAGGSLLTDWRAPAAEPFFGASHANPMGLAGRRRYRWSQGFITDYWDERFTLDGASGTSGAAGANAPSDAALEDLSAFIASLGGSRATTMHDVLGTIAADQDAIIRAPSRGTLVVDGGPGTGKTVVALHRAAYLIYADASVGRHPGGVLFVGPHQPFLNYVADVLPSLGEDGVQSCTLRHLLPEGAAAAPEQDPNVARLKSSIGMVEALDAAVEFHEQPPAGHMLVETPWADISLTPADWAEAFSAPAAGIPHNEARGEIWTALLDIVEAKFRADGGDPDGVEGDEEGREPFGSEMPALSMVDGARPAPGAFRRAAAGSRALAETLNRAWPLLEHTDIVGDLWRVPAYLRLCAPWLNRDEVGLLQRANPAAWTVEDLPLLDAAKRRLGDPEEEQRKRRQRAVVRAEKELMDTVVEELIAADDSELLVMTSLRGGDMSGKLLGQEAVPVPEPDALAGPFAHIVVDEAQELSDAQWQMLLARCPSRSFTVVGDRAQARGGFAESWGERLARVGLGDVSLAGLGVNYRTPREVMEEAAPVIREAMPDANVPTSIRNSGLPVRHGAMSELASVVDGWLAAHAQGTVCIIGAEGTSTRPDGSRVRTLTPVLAKGLEFDLVVLLQPESFGAGAGAGGTTRAVDRYVAMTRAVQELVVLA